MANTSKTGTTAAALNPGGCETPPWCAGNTCCERPCLTRATCLASPREVATYRSALEGGGQTIDVEPAECPCTEIDPNDCAPPPPGDCTMNEDCGADAFCHDMHCVPVIL